MMTQEITLCSGWKVASLGQSAHRASHRIEIPSTERVYVRFRCWEIYRVEDGLEIFERYANELEAVGLEAALKEAAKLVEYEMSKAA